MARFLRSAPTIATAVLAVGCATSNVGSTPTVELTRIGEAVQVTENAMSTRECEFVSDVPIQSSNPSNENAMRTLRNDAGNLGANVVLLVMESRSTISRAEGYLCAD